MRRSSRRRRRSEAQQTNKQTSKQGETSNHSTATPLILSSPNPKQQTPLKSQSISFLSPWELFFFSLLTILFPVPEGKRRFAAYFLFFTPTVFYPSFASLGTLSASSPPFPLLPSHLFSHLHFASKLM
jgi:hypothetical protein